MRPGSWHRTFAFIGLPAAAIDAGHFSRPVNPTTARKVDLTPSLRGALLDGYAPDLERLRSLDGRIRELRAALSNDELPSFDATGLRIGECLGVLWFEMDLQTARVDVSSTGDPLERTRFGSKDNQVEGGGRDLC